VVRKSSAKWTRQILQPFDEKVGPQMPAAVFRRDYFTQFLVDRLFDGRKAYETSSWWILHARNLATPGQALDALITIFFGRTFRYNNLIEEGIKLYSKALLSLRKDLQGPEALAIGPLATTATLAMYELVGASSDGSWIRHAGGLGGLIKARGPHRHKSGLEKQVYLENRTLLVSRAIIAEQRTFLAEPAWKTIPWEDDPKSKDPFDYLLDLAADASGFLEDANNLRLGNLQAMSLPGAQTKYFDLVSKLEKAFETLNAWWRAWANEHMDHCYERPPDKQLDISFDHQGPVFETVLYFNNFWNCYVAICHNAIRIIFLQLWHRLSVAAVPFDTNLNPPVEEANPLPLLGISNDMTGLSLEVLRATEFCETQAKKFLGTFCLMFPLWAAQKSIRKSPRITLWLHLLPSKNRNHKNLYTFGGPYYQDVTPYCGLMMVDQFVYNEMEHYQ
jgi:hypothetical protein